MIKVISLVLVIEAPKSGCFISGALRSNLNVTVGYLVVAAGAASSAGRGPGRVVSLAHSACTKNNL